MWTRVLVFAGTIAVSALLHLLVLLGTETFSGRPRPMIVIPPESVSVDLVPAQELAAAVGAEEPKTPAAEPPKEPPPAAASPEDPAPAAESPKEPAPAAEPRRPPSDQPSDPARIAALFNVPALAGRPAGAPDAVADPVRGFDAPATAAAALSPADVTAFKAHLRRCWTAPPEAAANVRLVLRLSLRPDGTLAGEPELIEASASPQGPALFAAALRALRQCQPYSTLPPDKYREWRLIDLKITARELTLAR